MAEKEILTLSQSWQDRLQALEVIARARLEFEKPTVTATAVLAPHDNS